MNDESGEHEPDYRFTLANERTFLAWIRTSLALLAGGIAVHALSSSLTEAVRTVLAVAAVALGLALTVSSYLRWRRVQEAMRRGVPLPHPWAVPLLATGVTIMAGAVAVIVVTG